MVLLFETPLRKLVIVGLDSVKPVMVKTVGGAIFVMLSSSVFSFLKIQSTAATTTDQVLMAKHLLEATLMGISSI